MVSFRIPWSKGFEDNVCEGMNFALCGAKLMDFMTIGLDEGRVFVNVLKFIFNSGL